MAEINAPKYEHYNGENGIHNGDMDIEKKGEIEAGTAEEEGFRQPDDVVKAAPLMRSLQGRHMQMIAIGELELAPAVSSWLTTFSCKAEVLAQVCSSDPAKLCLWVGRQAW
jgi:hypothetical protein